MAFFQTLRSNMKHQLVLYHYEGCGPCRRVKDTLKELKLEIEWRDIHQSEAALNELLTIGKLQQVPCLFIDGKPLYESADIIRWLRSNYGRAA
jgi:glutaredoxin